MSAATTPAVRLSASLASPDAASGSDAKRPAKAGTGYTQYALLCLMLLGALGFALQLQMSHGWRSTVHHFEQAAARRLREAPAQLARQVEEVEEVLEGKADDSEPFLELQPRQAAVSRPDAMAVGASHSLCAHRKPYHVLLTAASGLYQEWQSRIAYWQYRRLREENPCSDLGGFTRLLNTPGAKPDGLMEEIPTVLVDQLRGGTCDECDHHFVVMNRPWGLRQLLANPAFARIEEEYLLIMETDHLLLRPMPNRATPEKPVGFGFYYMTYKYDPPKLRPVVAKYHDPDGVDPVGPSPVVIHKALLQKVVEPFWQMCLTLKRDHEADKAFGWVLEMWGWSLATARMGIRHLVVPELQAEPANSGIHNLDRYFIYHYTFDLKTGPWSWSKRVHMGRYPEPLPTPPASAASSSKTFVEIMNGAMRALPDWGSRKPKVPKLLPPPPPPAASRGAVARQVSASGCVDGQGASCTSWSRVGGCGKPEFRARCCATCERWCAQPGVTCAPAAAAAAAAATIAPAMRAASAAAASSTASSSATLSATPRGGTTLAAATLAAGPSCGSELEASLPDGSYNRACCGKPRTECDDCSCGRRECCVTTAKLTANAGKAAAGQVAAAKLPPLEARVVPQRDSGGGKGGVGDCAHRKPYHVLLTAASGLYQEWQSRIAYWQYRRLREENPCSDLGGFTRLLNTPGAKPDGLMEEIPTVLVDQLRGGTCDECDHHFVVMNRPWGLRQLLANPAFARIEEEYLLIMETDHLLLRPMPNRATPEKPVGFGFYYMTYKYDPPKLRPVVAKYHDPDGVDPVGPSPVVIHKALLQKVVEPFWQMCLTLKRDHEADKAFGWVLEMWGWSLATARMGIRHLVVPELQAEPANSGIHNLDRYFIYHYTFDLKTGPWSWSKRVHMGRYPEPLPTPPASAASSSKTFVEIMNGAMRALPDWGSRKPKR